jgi:hypothetical protein
VLGVLIVGGLAWGVVAVLAGRARPPSDESGRGGRWWHSPEAGLAVITGLIYVNQVVVTVYVLRVHDGDPSFVARHLPDGWFALAGGMMFDTLAASVPAPGLLAPSVLRVNAVLELPWVVFAYLSACRWFSLWVYQQAVRLVVPVSVTYTATFCLIEWRLHNPYTADEIVLRLVAAVLVPLWAARTPATSPCVPLRPSNLFAGQPCSALGDARVLSVMAACQEPAARSETGQCSAR